MMALPVSQPIESYTSFRAPEALEHSKTSAPVQSPDRKGQSLSWRPAPDLSSRSNDADAVRVHAAFS